MNNRIIRGVLVVFAAFVLVFAPSVRADEKAVAGYVTFLDAEQAKFAIVDDSAEPYFNRLTPAEMTAKTGKPIDSGALEQQREECKARYRAACLSFTDEEKQALTQLVEKTRERLVEQKYPRFAEQPWSFLKVGANIEAGLPHTRGAHIVLSPRILGFMLKAREAGQAQTIAVSVLVHEQTHVLQRLHPEWFTKLYVDVFGFTKVAEIESREWLAERQVVNPDGTDTTWVMQRKPHEGTPRWVWPTLVFKDAESPALQSMEMVAIDVEPIGESVERFRVREKQPTPQRPLTPLTGVPEYLARVGTRQNLYHPNEITADLLSKIVVGMIREETDVTKRVRDWATEAFGKP